MKTETTARVSKEVVKILEIPKLAQRLPKTIDVYGLKIRMIGTPTVAIIYESSDKFKTLEITISEYVDGSMVVGYYVIVDYVPTRSNSIRSTSIELASVEVNKTFDGKFLTDLIKDCMLDYYKQLEQEDVERENFNKMFPNIAEAGMNLTPVLAAIHQVVARRSAERSQSTQIHLDKLEKKLHKEFSVNGTTFKTIGVGRSLDERDFAIVYYSNPNGRVALQLKPIYGEDYDVSGYNISVFYAVDDNYSFKLSMYSTNMLGFDREPKMQDLIRVLKQNSSYIIGKLGPGIFPEAGNAIEARIAQEDAQLFNINTLPPSLHVRALGNSLKFEVIPGGGPSKANQYRCDTEFNGVPLILWFVVQPSGSRRASSIRTTLDIINRENGKSFTISPPSYRNKFKTKNDVLEQLGKNIDYCFKKLMLVSDHMKRDAIAHATKIAKELGLGVHGAISANEPAIELEYRGMIIAVRARNLKTESDPVKMFWNVYKRSPRQLVKQGSKRYDDPDGTHYWADTTVFKREFRAFTREAMTAIDEIQADEKTAISSVVEARTSVENRILRAHEFPEEIELVINGTTTMICKSLKPHQNTIIDNWTQGRTERSWTDGSGLITITYENEHIRVSTRLGWSGKIIATKSNFKNFDFKLYLNNNKLTVN